MESSPPFGGGQQFSDECDEEEFDDFGGSVTPSTPDSSDGGGLKIQKLNLLADCSGCCKVPSFKSYTPPPSSPEPIDDAFCREVLAKYIDVANPTRRSLVILKNKLSEQVSSMKRNLMLVNGNADSARKAMNDDPSRRVKLPPLDVLLSAVRRGRVGALGKVPPIKCDQPEGVQADGMEAAVRSMEAKVAAAQKSLSKLKQFDKKMKRLTNGQDPRGTPMMLDAEVTVASADIRHAEKLFKEMFVAKMEWETYLARILATLSSERILPRLNAHMDKCAKDPSSIARIFVSLRTSALALDESDIHACNLLKGCRSDRLCEEPCQEPSGWENDPCFARRFKDPSPLDALKNLLLTTRSNFDQLTVELEELQKTVPQCTQVMIGILEGLR
jgi:hypothetical protein